MATRSSFTVAERTLARSTHDRLVAGVAAGVAAHLDVDPAVVRLGFVALTLFGGIGVPLYLAGWLVMADGSAEGSLAAHLLSRWNA